MVDMKISNDITCIGASDKNIKLFEGQYVLKNGMSYNSYIIKDEKNVILDTIDEKVTDIWLENLEKALDGEKPDYLIVSHMEPDHAYNIGILAEKYPEMKIVGNQITFNMISNFFKTDIQKRKFVVMEGDILDIGKHKLQFFMAPMVHWPEVMVTYEQTEKILFSADGFGKFGSLDYDEEWDCEARRYYFVIVGKYGMQVQALLKKAAKLDIKMICPLHGPILKENLEYYINKYDIWSKYEPEEKEGVFIAVASIYGNTLEAAKEMAKILEEKGVKKVVVADLAREDWAECVEDAFRYSKLIVASSSYNMGIFPPMEHFLRHLKDRNYQKRTVGIIENGSWAPSAGRGMKAIIGEMKDINLVEPMVTIKSRMSEENRKQMENFADEILKN